MEEVTPEPGPEKLLRINYECEHHKQTHHVELLESHVKNQARYPFMHVFLHGSEDGLDDILTILYIDATGKVRSVMQQELTESNDTIVSKRQLVEMVAKLVDETNRLRGELETMRVENTKYKRTLANLAHHRPF